MQIPSVLANTATHAYDAFLKACTAHDLQKRMTEPFKESLCLLLASSDYAAFQLETHPVWAFQIFDSDLTTPRTAKIYREKLKEVQIIESQEKMMHALRQFKNHEMIRILWRFVLKQTSFSEHLKELSDLADVIVQSTKAWTMNQCIQRYGIPMHEGVRQNLMIVALGKLGAKELNFSSDIDLIFCFPSHGKTEQGPKSIANEQFFIMVCQQFVRILSEVTEDGYVYRVDLRLRPHGQSGPLVLSFNALETYYQIHGRDWERYALIKARTLTGTRSEKLELHNLLNRFVFRRYLDFSVFQSLLEMKTKVQNEVKRRKLQNNLKLGPGGIRQIEFIAQMFQLIRGGKEWQFQHRRLLTILTRLKTANVISGLRAEKLKDAYLFLRRSEHILQMMRDEQTHTLPIDSISEVRLSWLMGFESYEAYIKALRKITSYVSKLFDQISTPLSHDEALTKEANLLKQIWMHPGDSDLQNKLRGKKPLVESFFEQLIAFKRSSLVKSLRHQSLERLDKFMPLLLSHVLVYPENEVLLKDCLLLISKIARRSSYLLLLYENPKALKRLILLCNKSRWVAKKMAQFPILLDELLISLEETLIFNKSELSDALEQTMRWYENDLDSQMEKLRQFKLAYTLKLAAHELLTEKPSDIGLSLTYLAEVILEKVTDLAWDYIKIKYPEKEALLHRLPNLGVIAYGNFGSFDLHYHSDLDLVFLYDDNDLSDELSLQEKNFCHEMYLRMAQRIIHMLSTQTLSGKLYDVDVRLRPGGGAGLLVTSFTAYAKYLAHDAWTWEHQALVRARLLLGEAKLKDKFSNLRQEVLTKKRVEQDLKKEILQMRAKMSSVSKLKKSGFSLKSQEGGITDIEFIVQYYVLSAAFKESTLLEYTKTGALLEKLAASKIIPQNWKEDLSLALDFYHHLLRLIILKQEPLVTLKEVEPWPDKVRYIWDSIFQE